jgi:hypothetical protein
MKTNVTVSDFRDAFRDCNRQDSFSYEGLGALFEWLEQYEDDCGTEVELDVIALCCDFSEYDSALDCIKECGYDFTPAEDQDEEDQESEVLDWLHENTLVVVFDSGIIIQAF